MIDQKYAQAIETICRRLSREPSPIWAFTGSLGFALQGMEVAVHDVDIQTDAIGAYEIERRLSKYSIRPVIRAETERIRSHFGALAIEGVKVEIMGDLQKRLPDGRWEDPVDVTPHRRWVDWNGMRLPVLSIEYECRAYEIMGRFEKAEMLRQWLKDRSNGRHGAPP
ncbi:MAG: hypothetical protein JW748_01140 [Anaerolineales bacterium]|nr:hypothetical protein [Anaerolineales bacterium]